MPKNPLMMPALAAALMAATLVFCLYPAGAQEGRHPGLSIVTPADGATVSGTVTVAYGFGGGDGMPGQEHHRHGRDLQVFLLVDQPAPEPGSTIQADASHIAFPAGQTEATLSLPPGPHSLQLAVLDPEGKIGRHGHPASPVSITVQ